MEKMPDSDGPISSEDQNIINLTQEILSITKLVEKLGPEDETRESLERSVRNWVEDMLKKEEGEQELREALVKISHSPYALSKIEEDPELFRELSQDTSALEYTQDPEKLDFFIFSLSAKTRSGGYCLENSGFASTVFAKKSGQDFTFGKRALKATSTTPLQGCGKNRGRCQYFAFRFNLPTFQTLTFGAASK